MRLIIYILLSLLIVSCGTNRKLFKAKKDNIELPDQGGDGVPDFVDADTVLILPMVVLESMSTVTFEENKSRDYQTAPKQKNNYVKHVEKMDIVDNTSIDTNSTKGTIAYSVPNEMQVGKQYIIKLRITKEKGKEVNQTLVLGDRNIPISDVNIDSKVTIENIRVEKTMVAQLISADGNFKVTPQNTDKQIIEDNEYTEWGWIVTPLKSGRTYLKLIIKIKIDTDGEVTYKDIVVFDKDIQVKANATFEVKNWLAEYWQWLMTTIIIPLVVWFFKRKKKGEEEENGESEE